MHHKSDLHGLIVVGDKRDITYLVLSCLVLSCLEVVLSCLEVVLSCLVLSCLLSCLVLSLEVVLSCLVLSCIVLRYEEYEMYGA